MKAITANTINASLAAGKETLATRNTATKEGQLMNLISTIINKDNSINKSAVKEPINSMNEDKGFHLYRNLEFSKEYSIKPSHNLQMEIICSRLF
ncbi:MAG: hypothetical protein K0Q99_1121 [Clostridia bacterium]|nr:hypothetical protein [Clostridia bacterium]